MTSFILRSIWRLLVLAAGLAIIYLIGFRLFPWLDTELPIVFALLIAYIVLAYFALPALIRFLRVMIKPNHIPLYATTADGWPSDPVNIVIVAKSRHKLVRTMKKAGWYTADKATLRNTLREGWAVFFDKPYPTAPFSHLYLFNRKFDIGFQLPYGENGSPRKRHHVRFWELRDPAEQKDHGHFSFWIRHFRHFISRRQTVWIGAATDDLDPYGIRWYNLQITHRTHPHHHKERDFIIKTLEETGYVKNIGEIKAGEPLTFRSQQIGTNFVTDGKLKIIELK